MFEFYFKRQCCCREKPLFFILNFICIKKGESRGCFRILRAPAFPLISWACDDRIQKVQKRKKKEIWDEAERARF